MQDFQINETKEYDKTVQNSNQKNNKKDYVSIRQWVGLYLVLGIIGAIPVIGPFIDLLILMYLSFNKNVNITLRNGAKAYLIVLLIAVVVFIILNFLFFGNSLIELITNYFKLKI